MSADQTPSPLERARFLHSRGPALPPPAALSWRERWARRLIGRIVRPHVEHQRDLDGAMVEVASGLEQELAGLRIAVEDLAQRLAWPGALAELERAAHAVPYMDYDELGSFTDPIAGSVHGYRVEAGNAPAPAFVDAFRGSEERVRDRLDRYLSLLDGHAPVLDMGCGRGELLDLLQERDIEAVGVDRDPALVERCRAKGHSEVHVADANDFLERAGEDAAGAVFSAQFVEHLPFGQLQRFLELSHRTLEPGGLLVFETVNPHSASALRMFWVDPTHQHPIFPEAAVVLCRMAGYGSAYYFHPMGTGDVGRDRFVEDVYAVVARP